MKYKIIKKISKKLKEVNINIHPSNKKEIKVEISEWYEARRKGRIFGFWHKVGHECDYEGNIVNYTEDTIEGIEDYIYKYHDVEFGKHPIEIIKEIKL